MARLGPRLRGVMLLTAAAVAVVVLSQRLQVHVYLKWNDATRRAAQHPQTAVELVGRAPRAVDEASGRYDRTMLALWAVFGIGLVGYVELCVARGWPIVTHRSTGMLATTAFVLALSIVWFASRFT